jgi:hypothetical protein
MGEENDHDLLIRLDEKVSQLINQVSSLTNDHEERIRNLEKWRWYVVGIASTLSILVPYVMEKFFGQ